MVWAIVAIVAALFVAALAIATLYVLGLRSRNSKTRNAGRRFHRAVGNPLQMRSAGACGAFASVIRHRGRRTGKTYQTPVWAAPTEDGFVIAIVYGTGTDWLKNVVGGGDAAIVHRGHVYRVGRPEIVPMDSARVYFPARLQAIHRRLHIDQCLRVRRLEVAQTSRAQDVST